MNNHKALIIAFEGLDCSFKETNTKALQTFLKDKYPNKNIYLYSFPNYSSESSYFIRSWLSRKYIDQFNNMKKNDIAKFISTIYTLDRFDTFKTEDIWSKINNDDNIIIFDRYSMSNLYYQCANLSSIEYIPLLNSIFNFEHKDLNLPLEDITIIMRTPFDMIVNKLSSKNNKDKNELDLVFLKRVYNSLDNLMSLIKNNDQNFEMNHYRNNEYIKEIWVNNNNTFKSKNEVFNDVKITLLPLLDNYYLKSKEI